MNDRTAYMALDAIEQRVCDIAADTLNIARREISPDSRLIEDLHCDSLELMELLMELEDQFGVTVPNSDPDPICKSIFIRKDFRLIDIAEAIYLQQGTGKPQRPDWREKRPVPNVVIENPFC